MDVSKRDARFKRGAQSRVENGAKGDGVPNRHIAILLQGFCSAGLHAMDA